MERTRPAASVGLLFSLADADELGRGGYLGFFDGDKATTTYHQYSSHERK